MGKKKAQWPEKQVEQLVALISVARVKAGLSQRQLSVKLGLHEVTVGRIERGVRRMSVVEFLQICSILGLSPVELLNSVFSDGFAFAPRPSNFHDFF